MKCFLACFTASKHNKRLHALSNCHSRHTLPLPSKTVEIPIPVPLLKKLEEQQSCNCFIYSNENDSVLSVEKAERDVIVEKYEEKSNLVSSKEESEDFDFKNDGNLELGESSESLFSLSIDSSKHRYGGEVGEKEEVSSPIPKSGSAGQRLNSMGSTGRTQIQAVLTPVENIPQFKIAKATATWISATQDKENINSNTSSFEPLCKRESKEIAVDTSLSSWLIQPETSSPCSAEGRHILGTLAVNQLPGSVSPKQKHTPILGTVGSYWSHTGRTMDSDSSSSSIGVQKPVNRYAKDEGGNCDSTPFQARLDRARCDTVLQI